LLPHQLNGPDLDSLPEMEGSSMNSTIVKPGFCSLYEQDNRSLCDILKALPHTGYISMHSQKIQPVPAKN
jgi:hypothetical protein